MKTKQEIEAEIDRIFSTTGWQGLTFERFEKIVIELSGVEAPEGYVRILWTYAYTIEQAMRSLQTLED
jgi:uncharacterized protein YukE